MKHYLLDFAQLQNVEVILTTAQLLALKATPIELIPAPAAGKAIHLIGGVVTYNKGTTAFTVGNTDENLELGYDTGTTSVAVVETTGLIDQAASKSVTIATVKDIVVLAAKSLKAANFGTAEWTAGATSTVKLNLLYDIVTL